MKATLLFLAAGVMVVAADDKDDKKNAAKPNTRFLGGHGGPGFGGPGFGNQDFGNQGFGNQGFGGLGFGGQGFNNFDGHGFNSFGGQGFNNFGGGLGGLFGGFPSPVAPPSTCRHWCRTPQNQAYCCEDAREVPSLVGVVKPGRCPPVRPVCPPTRSFQQPPATCSNDGRCGGFDKCCFDTCLQEHVCKPPFGFGF
ncbi:uncharacterized protein LOC127003452 [Eriocheir sinensis]|uniref:uncharacterized protein LOC127003452 n=1 Tax=Eriocheir sinensis TaxID=95602 RepID=UPI0021CA977B|nr:uncharacterized protein LOC127003452 [Eriocheir sinensis]